jgi:sphingomyelin phosphodiesterase 2
VGLQEVWLKEDRETFIEFGLQHNLPYWHAFKSGILGTCGLLILSRFPILDVHFFRFKVNGQLLRVDHGDFYAGKGVGYAKLQISEDRTVDVFITHTIANYTHAVEDDHYRADRLTQHFELARIINMTTSHYNERNNQLARNVILLGTLKAILVPSS